MSAPATQIVVRIRAHGGDLTPDGELLRYRGPTLTEELRAMIRENKTELLSYLSAPQGTTQDPVACRGCCAVIPGGTTLCPDCGSKDSPLIRYALELIAQVQERTLRGEALVCLDQRWFPKLNLADGRSVGPGLLAWAPFLREADTATLRMIIEATRPSSRRDARKPAEKADP